MTSNARNVIALALSVALATTLLGLTARWTREPIAVAREQARLGELLVLVPDSGNPEERSIRALAVPLQYRTGLGLDREEPAYQVQLGGEIAAVIVPVTSDQGYGGRIRALVGIDRAGTITGVRVTEQRETPGIGDRILAEKSDWIQGFVGKSRDHPPALRWQVRSDGGAFDQITGATISSRAVVRQVRRALDYFHEDRLRLLTAMSADGAVTP